MCYMSDKLKKLQVKKLIQEYNFIQSDFDLKSQIIEENKKDFIDQISDGIKKINPEFELQIPKNNENPIKETLDEKFISDEVKNKVKKVYREIVKLIHPDKTESNEFVELYYLATNYSEEFNLLGLYIICSELKINFEFDDEDVSFLEKLIEVKKKECDNLTKSFIWVWYKSKDDEQKNKIVDLFIKNNFK